MNILDTDTSFLLKLDQIDVNYVPYLNFQYDGGIFPLWTAKDSKNRRYGDFVQFQVLAGKKNDKEPVLSYEDDIISQPKYICVICDTDVPILYKKQHNNSDKHKTCLKIIEAVLVRIQNHIKVDDENAVLENSPNNFYCETCSVIVENTNKVVHEESSTHKKSFLRDRVLNDFLNVYLSKDYLDKADMQYLNINQSEYEANKTVEKDISKAEETIDLDKNEATSENFVAKNPSYDENCNALPIPSKQKRKRVIPNKKKKLALKMNTIVDNDHADMEDNTSKASSSNNESKVHSYPEQSNNSTNEQLDSGKNDNSEIKACPSHDILTTMDNIRDDLKKIPFYFNVNIYKTLQPSNVRPDNELEIFNDDIPDSIEETQKSIDELNNAVEKQCVIDEKSSTGDTESLTDDENSSTDNEDSSTDDEDTSTDDENSSIKNSRNGSGNCAIDDEQVPNSHDIMKTIEHNNNETKGNNSMVNYIMLGNTKEVGVEADKTSILSKIDLEKYLKLVDGQRLSCVDKDYVQITTLDDCIVTVRAGNFNGLFSKDGRLQCRVCMAMVDYDPLVHIYTENHLKHVQKPLENMHCYREITNTFKHCIHCNDTFCELDIHKSLASHLKALKESMSRSISPKPVEPKKCGKTFCEPCNLYIDSHNFNSHTNGNNHKNNLSLFFTKEKTEINNASTDKTNCNECNTQVLISNFAAHLSEHANAHKMGDSGKKPSTDKIFCEPCNMQVGKNNFPSHVYGKNHQASLAVAQEPRGLSKNKHYCTACKIYVENMTVHSFGNYHEYHLAKNCKSQNIYSGPAPSTSNTNSYSYQYKFTDVGATCKICCVNVPNKAENLSEHTNGRLHKANFETLLKSNKMRLVNDKYFCDACKVSMGVTKELDHIQAKTHKNSLTQQVQSLTDTLLTLNPKTQATTANTTENIVSPSTSEAISHSEMKLSGNKTMCRVCDIKITSNKPELIMEHTNGKAHRTKVAILLDKNRFKVIKNEFFCDVCKTKVNPNIIVDHIRSESHKTALAEGLKPQPLNMTILYHCESCEVDVLNTPSSIQEHKQTVGHKISEAFYEVSKGVMNQPAHHHFESSNSPNSYKCRICQVKVSAEDVIKHVETLTHNLKYRTVLLENKIQKLDDKFVCQICSVDVKVKEELKHIQSLTHLFEKQVSLSTHSEASSSNKMLIQVSTSSKNRANSNVKSKTGYRCVVCQVDVPNSPQNIKIHEQGRSHVANLMTKINNGI